MILSNSCFKLLTRVEVRLVLLRHGFPPFFGFLSLSLEVLLTPF